MKHRVKIREEPVVTSEKIKKFAVVTTLYAKAPEAEQSMYKTKGEETCLRKF
jgi:hypothetical protein